MILCDVDIANDDCDRYQYDIDGSGFIEADELKVSLHRKALCPDEGNVRYSFEYNLKSSQPLTLFNYSLRN